MVTKWHWNTHYDNQLEADGRPAYFAGQRIAIEADAGRDRSNPGDADGGSERVALRLPAFAGHYFVLVTLRTARPRAFMVDTGATRMTLSEVALQNSV